MPLILKAMHLLDGSAYEQVMASTRRRERLRGHKIDLGTRVRKHRYEGRAQADEAVDRVVAQVNQDRRIGEEEARWDPTASSATSPAYTSSRPSPVEGLNLADYVEDFRGHGIHEMMPVPVKRDLALAGWLGTALLAALALGTGFYSDASGRLINAEWLVWLVALGAVSLAVFTKGFRQAPDWALKACFAILIAGLVMPLLIAATNL